MKKFLLIGLSLLLSLSTRLTAQNLFLGVDCQNTSQATGITDGVELQSIYLDGTITQSGNPTTPFNVANYSLFLAPGTGAVTPDVGYAWYYEQPTTFKPLQIALNTNSYVELNNGTDQTQTQHILIYQHQTYPNGSGYNLVRNIPVIVPAHMSNQKFFLPTLNFTYLYPIPQTPMNGNSAYTSLSIQINPL